MVDLSSHGLVVLRRLPTLSPNLIISIFRKDVKYIIYPSFNILISEIAKTKH